MELRLTSCVSWGSFFASHLILMILAMLLGPHAPIFYERGDEFKRRDRLAFLIHVRVCGFSFVALYCF